MRRGLIAGIVAGVVAVATAVALLLYLLMAPEKLARNWESRAEPQHEEVDKALEPVFFTFSARSLGQDVREIERADGPGEYVRAVERVTSRQLRDLRLPLSAIRRAERKLGDIDESDLTESPDWPFIGGRGELGEAEEIAGQEREYLTRARRFLRDYKRLIDYLVHSARVVRSTGVTIGLGAADVPDSPQTPGEITRPWNRIIRKLASQRRRESRVKPPPGLGAMHRNALAQFAFTIAELRRYTAAVNRYDVTTALQLDRRLSRGSRRYDRRTRREFVKLVGRSTYVRQISRLKRHEREIGRAYVDL
ncbi:MAG TPA: hypothetical protein VF715_15485 [Thermoleophilaceae bacterium]